METDMNEQKRCPKCGAELIYECSFLTQYACRSSDAVLSLIQIDFQQTDICKIAERDAALRAIAFAAGVGPDLEPATLAEAVCEKLVEAREVVRGMEQRIRQSMRDAGHDEHADATIDEIKSLAHARAAAEQAKAADAAGGAK